MPTILFGSHSRPEHLERGQFHCPACDAPRPFQRTVVRRRVSVLALPSLPAGRFGEFVECGHCRATFRPEVLAYDAGTVTDVVSEYQRTMKRVLALLVVTDGRVRGREVETVQEIFEAVTGVRLAREAVLAEIEETFRSPITVARYLAQAMGYLNDYGKEQVLRACALVSRCDGEVHEREVAMIRHLARVLRLEPERVQRLLPTDG